MHLIFIFSCNWKISIKASLFSTQRPRLISNIWCVSISVFENVYIKPELIHCLFDAIRIGNVKFMSVFFYYFCKIMLYILKCFRKVEILFHVKKNLHQYKSCGRRRCVDGLLCEEENFDAKKKDHSVWKEENNCNNKSSH